MKTETLGLLNTLVSTVSSIQSVVECRREENVRAKLESILTLQQSLTEHYFLCKDTTCT